MVKLGIDLGCIPAGGWLTVRLMAVLKNSRHEKFAQGVASGLTGADAYRQVLGYTGKQADGLATRWMERPGVRERIAELKEANSRKATLSRERQSSSYATSTTPPPRKSTWTLRSCNPPSSRTVSQ